MRNNFLYFLSVLLLLATSCGSGSRREVAETIEGDNLLSHSRLLSLTEQPDGSYVATIENPWDTLHPLQRLRLLPQGVEAPTGSSIPTLRIPLERALVYSSVHNSLLVELGAIDAIAGVCDTAYISSPALKERIREGRVSDCGNSSQPTIERVMSLRPDAILLSPYEDSTDHSSLSRLGTTVIECADYMEPTPLGRAEWAKFYGLLFGQSEKADSLWTSTLNLYTRVSSLARAASSRPRVLVDRLYQGTWYVPGPESLLSVYLHDAGARNAFDDARGGSTLALSAEQVVASAADADVWLIRYYDPSSTLSLKTLASEHPAYSRIKAFTTRRVYGANTARVDMFEEAAFQPDRLLGQLVTLFHPSASDSAALGEKPFFQPLK